MKNVKILCFFLEKLRKTFFVVLSVFGQILVFSVSFGQGLKNNRSPPFWQKNMFHIWPKKQQQSHKIRLFRFLFSVYFQFFFSLDRFAEQTHFAQARLLPIEIAWKHKHVPLKMLTRSSKGLLPYKAL